MAFSFRSSDPSPGAGLRRIAASQLASALTALEDEALGPDETAHQVRRRCKKVRALVRLARPAFAEYDAVNAVLRDTARLLAPMRDAKVRAETFDRLMAIYAGDLSEEDLEPARRVLAARHHAVIARDAPVVFDVVRANLAALSEDTESWHLDPDNMASLEVGLMKTYRKARRTFAAAVKTRDGELIHEWRKFAKYHWLHLRLLGKGAGAPTAPRIVALDQITDWLGEHHDLLILQELLRDQDLALAVSEEVHEALRSRLDDLEIRALDVGRTLFASSEENVRLLPGRGATAAIAQP